MKWANAVTHCGDAASSFINHYFRDEGRQVLVICGAGFDPRSVQVTASINQTGVSCRGIFIREERTNPHQELLRRAQENQERLTALIPRSDVLAVDIFAKDGAVVGAKQLLRRLMPLVSKDEGLTDIVLDLSALSIGMSFPLVKCIHEEFGTVVGVNIHLFVAEDVDLDTGIVPDHADQAMYIPGFSGGALLDENASCTRLWIPQLVANRQTALRRIHDFVSAEETCPILPFPAKRLRRGDELLEAFVNELTDAWAVHPRNYVYASEREPIDLYRILLRLDDARRRVYEAHGGSLLILSPVGSRVLAMGALLAALERDFPVAYLESIGYDLSPSATPPPNGAWPIVHVWLSGAAYA